MLIWPFRSNLHYSDMNLSLNGGNGAAARGNISVSNYPAWEERSSPIYSACSGRPAFAAPSEAF